MVNGDDLMTSQSQINNLREYIENVFEEGNIDAVFSTQINNEMEEIINQEEVSVSNIF